MALAANNARRDSAQALAEAFDVHAALVATEKARPHLADNPRWRVLRMDAYEAFHSLMGVPHGRG